MAREQTGQGSRGDTLALVKDYYGRVLKSSADLKSTACCTVERLPRFIQDIVAEIHPEVKERFYGCGVIAPAALSGLTVLDLGCGSGRDIFVLSKLVGSQGKVIGVDMTEEQLNIARRHLDFQAHTFGFAATNVKLCQGFIEDLAGVGVEDASIDVVVSNCVLNLSPAKEKAFSEIWRVLKPGGELHFSDVFADRRLPREFMHDPVLLGECLGGALYFEDFRRLMAKLGAADVRTLQTSAITVTNPDIQAKLGSANFVSRTMRAFKLELEDRCEDYGQVATYLGTLSEAPYAYRLDDHHLFEAHRPMTVCSNTAAMLQKTRLAPHFQITGDLSRHFGLFPCGPTVSGPSAAQAGACC